MRPVFSSLLLCGLLAASASAQPVLYDFYADWCGPCRSMTATVDRLAAEGCVVQRVNVDRQPELAAQYHVQTIPCFVWVEGGREVHREVGAVSIERLRWRSPKLEARNPKADAREPHPAWRYERAEGRRAAVVRIFCEEAAHGRSIGSGTLVRWNGRVVVLTARHVVRGAAKITVEICTGKAHAARVLATDPTWDCAVLELMGRPAGVPVAEIELGPNATQENGDRLESCGYGPDGRLAVNSGLFLGYRRSSAALQGPDDWMVISGRARPGDSGGPVFNARGRLVGVLWGTDGEEVVCVQAGRLHVLLEAAVPAHAYQPQSCECDGRCPTPPMPDSNGSSDWSGLSDQSDGRKEPVLGWRKGVQSQERATAGALQRIQGDLATIASRPTPVTPSQQPDPRVDQALQLSQEANAKLDALAAALARSDRSDKSDRSDGPATLRERIHEKAEEIKEKVDGVLESPFAKHLAAILGVVFVIGVGTWIAISQHRKAGTKTVVESVADKVATATAGTPVGPATNLLDKVVNDLGQRLRDLDAKMDAKLQAVQQQVTQTALATPAPSQSQPAASAAPAAKS